MTEVNYWSRLNNARVSRRSVIRGAALGGAGLAGAALIGCGGGDDKKTDEPAAKATEAVLTPKAGGRLARAQEGDPTIFDQHGQSTTLVNLPASPGFNTVVQFDFKDSDEKPDNIKPDLATSWEVSPDGQTYTFKFVQNAKFHDGTPFKAADVVASLKRQIEPPKFLAAPPRKEQLDRIKSFETPDQFTLKLTMKQPVSPLSMLPILAQGWMTIYAEKDAFDDKFDWKTKVNGTGPYRDMKYTRGNKVTWERNKEYFVKDRPYLDGLDIFIVPDASTRNANLQSGQLQMGTVAAKDWDSLKAAIGDKANYFTRSSISFNVINYNTSKAPWKDERVRQAVNLALIREEGIKILVGGDGNVGGYLLPGGQWALSEAEIRKLPGYQKQDANSVGEAKKLLDAAGVKDGLAVTLLTRNLQSYQDTSVWVIDQLSRVGMKAKSDIVETATAYDRMNKRDFDLAPWGHGLSLDDPDALWLELYLKGAPRNYSELSTDAIEEAFKKQTVELNPAKRKELVNELQKASLPALGKSILYWSNARAIAYKSVQNWTQHVTTYNNQRFENVWLNA